MYVSGLNDMSVAEVVSCVLRPCQAWSGDEGGSSAACTSALKLSESSREVSENERLECAEEFFLEGDKER